MSETPQNTNQHQPAPMTWRLLIAVIALGFAGFGFWAQGELKARMMPALQSALLYPEPKPLAEFSLRGGDGQPFGRERWLNGWDLVFFGYTHCPDVCPNTMNMLHLLDREMRQKGGLVQYPRVTFISVDPDRDPAEKLDEYARYFNPAFMSATGQPQQLTDLTHQLGAIFFIEEHAPDQLSYTVDHSSAILLVDPEARLYARFSAPHDIDHMAADLATIMDSY